MSAAFPVLPSSAYVTFVNPVAHRGANPTAHLAEIRYPVQHAPVLSFVKLLPADRRAAANEAVSWLLLRSAGVAVPQHTALVLLHAPQAARLVRQIDARLKLPAHMLGGNMVLAWCAQFLPARSIRALFAGLAGDSRFLQVLCTAEGAALAALDEAMYQLDRNLGNVLYEAPTRIVAVDHEQALANHPWHLSDPPHPEPLCPTMLRLINGHLSREISTDQFEQALTRVTAAAEAHASALQACRQQIADLVTRLYADPDGSITDRVLSFLLRRTADRWMCRRLGVVG